MNEQPLPRPGLSAVGEELPVEPLDPVMVAEVLEALAGRLESLEALVEAMTNQLLESPAGGPWAWRHLTGSQTRALLTQLRDWVDWLITRYELRGEAETIPTCWFGHPVAVEELTALMVAWKAAYSQTATAPSDALAGWHDRWLWPTLHRLNIQLHVWGKCTGGAHTESRPAPPVTDEKSFEWFLAKLWPRVDEERHTEPADALNKATVKELVSSGEAVALLPGDQWSPIRYSGRWYAVPDGTHDESWRPVDDERGAQLDLMASRLNRSGRPGAG